MKRNEVVIDCRLLKRSALRYTPAGTPVLDLLLTHKSSQVEAGGRREARCEIEAVAIGDITIKMGAFKLNQPVQISGFLAQLSANNRQLILHVLDVATLASGDRE